MGLDQMRVTNINTNTNTVVDSTYRAMQPVVSTTVLPAVPVVTTSLIPQQQTTVVRTQSPSKIINNTNNLYSSQYQNNALINSTVTMGQPKAVTTVTRN
jgi:hypothetical protein